MTRRSGFQTSHLRHSILPMVDWKPGRLPDRLLVDVGDVLHDFTPQTSSLDIVRSGGSVLAQFLEIFPICAILNSLFKQGMLCEEPQKCVWEEIENLVNELEGTDQNIDWFIMDKEASIAFEILIELIFDKMVTKLKAYFAFMGFTQDEYGDYFIEDWLSPTLVCLEHYDGQN